MDRFIERFTAVEDGDLMLCHDFGVAYQKDRSKLVPYDAPYYAKCAGYDGSEIAEQINAGRIAMVGRHVGQNRIVDVGIGSGEFIRKRPNTFGHDVNPVAMEWLKRNDLWTNRLEGFAGVSMWDVIEHVETPETYFRQIPLGGHLFCSLPIMRGLGSIRASKHYRPNEHIYYFEEHGFLGWMELHGFQCLETATFEIDAGRDSIFSYALRRYRWPK